MLGTFRLALAGTLLAVSSAASATIVNWNIGTLVFTDGTEATGNFDWNSDLGAVVDWDFAITDGADPQFGAATFNPGTSTAGLTGSPADTLNFVHDTITGGSGNPLHFRLGIGDLSLLDVPAAALSLVPTLATDNGAVLCYNCSPFITLPAGAALPALSGSAALMLGAGLVGFGWRRAQAAR